MGKPKLTPEDRDKIAILHAQGYGVRSIAKKLDRSPSTISHELKVGTWHSFTNDTLTRTSTYVAIHAQELRNERAKASIKTAKLLANAKLASYVEAKLRMSWSPEQIAGRLPIDYPDDDRMRIGHETIYRYVYAPEQAVQQLWEYLPRKQKKRRKTHGRKAQRSRIPDRVSIKHRPVAANDRTEFGHWEGDSVEGRRADGDGIHTEVERLSRKLMASKINRITAEETAQAQLTMFKEQPKLARLSTTLDNGKENSRHFTLRTLGMQTYFADPYSSWQRGTNENTNGLLRRYLPKRTSFVSLSQAELDDIVEEINNRPRKVLGFYTANEVYWGQLENASVRIWVRM
jgi:IS30 family transposase